VHVRAERERREPEARRHRGAERTGTATAYNLRAFEREARSVENGSSTGAP
jgi:hypothetical protein